MRLCWLALVLIVSAVWADRSPTEQARDKLAAKLDIGQSAPDWLVNAETYAIGYDPSAWEALARSKVSFITHCPINREFFARCHALGIRCFPYVTFYQADAQQSYQGLSLREHPECIEIDQAGNRVRTGFWDSEDAKNMYTTCPDEPGYQDLMVAWVKRVMELGADGVFVDNLSNRAQCYGPKFGRHKHLYNDPNHAFAMLLKRVREVIQQARPDGAVLGNSAWPTSLPKEFWKYLDAEMLESYICTWVSTERWFDWDTRWHKAGQDLFPYVQAGKQIQCLAYLGHTPYGVREDALFTYCTARLHGMVWSGGLALGDRDSSFLHQLRLGPPLADEQQENGVWYRPFERGLIAVNPQKTKAAAITIKPPVPTTRLTDISVGGAQAWVGGQQSADSVDLVEHHSGGRAIKITNLAGEDSIVSQTVTLDQQQPTPIVAGGWSKAQGATGAVDGNYAIYLDLLYQDGTPLFGQTANFSVGTHGWEYQQVIVKPTKPIKSLSVNVLYRYRPGTVWFDDISLKEGADPVNGVERLANGGFETPGFTSRVIDVAQQGQRLTVPAYSGRIYLYGADTKEELAVNGPRVTIVTRPGLGEVRFRIDGFDYWTHSGHWTTEYVLGPEFGRFTVVLDRPGKHTIEVVDVAPSPMNTPKGYGAGERLGDLMDPSRPTQPLGKRKFKFRQWAGVPHGEQAKLDLEVQGDLTLTAEFDVEG